MSEQTADANYRILDAAANRAGEGFRTLEEYTRFALNDGDLTERIKRMRHQLTASLAPLARDRLLAARDTPGDVGTSVTLDSEIRRESARDIVGAAAARTQQSLRVLEEYSKPIDPLVASRMEQIRYRCYSLFAEIEMRQIVDSRNRRIDQASVYVLIDAGDNDDDFATTIQSLVDAGADVIQLRDPGVDDRTLFNRAGIASRITRGAETLFIVNNRPDIALAVSADGVHVGQEDLPLSAARAVVGQNRLVGVSTHSVEQARDAAANGADYIGCGPVFAGQTKSFDRYVGTDLLRGVAGKVAVPAFAIGGIDETNVKEVASAGFDRVAVSGALRDANDPSKTIAKLKAALSRR